MSSRSTRRPQSLPSLSSIEALLLAQATWEFGAAPTNWPVIAKLLSKHPLLSRPKSFFTPQSCHSMYENILKEAGLEISEANNAPQADTNLNLARKHYRLRFEELRELILAEESKFKTVLKEIEEIRAGLWDTKIHAGTTDESSMEKDSATVRVFDGVLGSSSRTKDNANVIQPAPAEVHLSASKTDENDYALREMSSKGTVMHSKSNSRAPDDEGVDRDEPDISEKEISQQAKDDVGEHTDQRQEEEEEEVIVEEESKEEEEEASQGQEEIENEDEAMASAQLGAETDSEHEPVVLARRSSRRRKPSAMPAPQPSTRTRLRPRARVTESELQTADSDNETKEILPGAGDERTSSPFDPGNVKRRDGKRKASFVDSVDSPQDKKRLRGDSEPAEEDEPGPSSHNTRARTTRNASRTEEQVAFKRFQNVIGMLHSQISQHRNGTIFHNPIKPSEAPDYHEIVKRPLDLKTIKARVKDGVISNSLEFQRDIYLMFANAMMYNRPGSDVYVMAEDMMLESEAQINTFRQTEGLVRRGQRS